MTKEERKEYNKKYKEKNKDRIREQYLKKYKLDKTYHKDYYEKVKNNSEYKDKVKKYKENNKGRLREYNKNYQKTVDSTLILGQAHYQDIAERCPQCFKPFVEFLENLSLPQEDL